MDVNRRIGSLGKSNALTAGAAATAETTATGAAFIHCRLVLFM
jgi:hypothetical protein